jgi:hypothetical protein
VISQEQNQAPQAGSSKLGERGKLAGWIALAAVLALVGIALIIIGLAATAEGASRGWLALGLGGAAFGGARYIFRNK